MKKNTNGTRTVGVFLFCERLQFLKSQKHSENLSCHLF